MNHSNEILCNVLKECLQNENEAVPIDSEIKKQYTPSNKFIKYMNHLIRREKFKEKYKIVYENRRRIYKLVAGAAVVVISINIGVTLFLPKTKSDNLISEKMAVESTSDTTDLTSTESTLAGPTADTALESTTESTTESEIANETGLLWIADLTGKNEVVLRIENNTEESYTYTNILKVEKYENERWTTIYSKGQIEETVLNPGDYVEEKLKLSDYEIVNGGSYILYRNINNVMVTVNIEIDQ